MLRLMKVIGDSMSPTLQHGDYVLALKPLTSKLLSSKLWSIRPGLLYVVKHAGLGLIIKRLERIESSRFYFSGDNPKSVPDTIIGSVPKSRIIGVAVLAISKTGVKILNKK